VDLAGWNSDKAYAAGLRFVHQQPAVFSNMSIAENIAFGTKFPTRAGGINWKQLNARTGELLERFGVAATPTTPLGAPARRRPDPGGDHPGRSRTGRTPTAASSCSTSPPRRCRRRRSSSCSTACAATPRPGRRSSTSATGWTRCCRSPTASPVLRDGRKVNTVDAAGLTEADLVEMIVGRPLDRVFPDPVDGPEQDVVLSARGLRGGPLVDVSFDLHRGEVLGIAGLLGSGRSELLRMVFGAYPRAAGTITLDGKDRHFSDAAAAMRAGVAYVPEERQADALFQGASVRHNLSMGSARAYFRRLLFSHKTEKKDSADSIRRFLIRVAVDTQPVETLSGGNAQKVVLARWLRRRPRGAAARRADPGRRHRRPLGDLHAHPRGDPAGHLGAARRERPGGAGARRATG
jgi:ribose transport system ATP-binding protein